LVSRKKKFDFIIETFSLESNQKYIFSLIALNENNDTVIPEQFYDFQMPSEGKF
jgi:hypothetical protein